MFDTLQVLHMYTLSYCYHPPSVCYKSVFSLSADRARVCVRGCGYVCTCACATQDKDAFRVFYTSLGSSVTGALVALKLESLLKCFLAMIQTNVIDIPVGSYGSLLAHCWKI